MWRREARQKKFLRKPKTKNPGVEICQGSQCSPFLGENRDTLYHLLKQGGLWSAGSCDWCGFCSHAKKKHWILGFSTVFGHEAGEKLKQWLQTVPCSWRNNECKKTQSQVPSKMAKVNIICHYKCRKNTSCQKLCTRMWNSYFLYFFLFWQLEIIFFNC